MDLHQLRFALFKITLLVFLGTSWVFTGFIMESRPEEEADVDPLTSLVRLPASLPAQLPEKIPDVFGPNVKPAEPVRMDTVKLPCWDQTGRPPMEIGSRWVRLVGKACQNDMPVEAVSVRNLANGYVATVFDTNRAGLTTDFIPLESGKNEILIRFEPEPGVKLENQITLNR